MFTLLICIISKNNVTVVIKFTSQPYKYVGWEKDMNGNIEKLGQT